MRKIDRLLDMLTSWGCDRWVHLVAALVVAWLTSTATMIVTSLAGMCVSRPILGIAGVAGGALLSLVKEIYDKRTQGLFDMSDLTAGFVGCALFFIIYSV
jgi:hypothetical protein